MNKNLFKIITLILIIGYSNNSLAQKKMSNEEILNYWRMSVVKRIENQDTLYKRLISGFKPSIQKKIISVIDSLKNEKIDTFGVYIESFSGEYFYSLSDTCKLNSYSIIYFLWCKNKNYYARKMINQCDFGIKKMQTGDYLEYYKHNIHEIKNEFFMPIIIGAELDSKKRLTYSTISNSDDRGYSIYFWLGNNYSYHGFEKSYITNNKSLFYDYNLNLKSYKWFKLINKQVKELY